MPMMTNPNLVVVIPILAMGIFWNITVIIVFNPTLTLLGLRLRRCRSPHQTCKFLVNVGINPET